MKNYTVKTVREPIDWDSIDKACILPCQWSPNTPPNAYMQAVYITGQGIVFHIKSLSPPERAENWEADSPVYEDSCLEAFVSFDGKHYVNMEANSNGALLCAFGESRHNRISIAELGCEMPMVTAVEGPDFWEVFHFLPDNCIRHLFGSVPFKGMEFEGNFYACGDLCPAPYYSSWNPVNTPSPDFHRPEFFGRLLIE